MSNLLKLSSMKQYLLSLGFMMFAVASLALNNQPNSIPIRPNPDITKPIPPKDDVTPLTLDYPDIEATYFMDAITFVFNADLGNCIIDVININTGDTWSASCDGIGSTSIYTSGDEGNYMIYIDTENGAYTGEFVL